MGNVIDDMRLQIPSYDKHSVSRITRELPVSPPTEAFWAEFAERRAEIQAALEQKKTEEEWGTCYTSHPVVQANPGRDAIPAVLYFDGVPFGQRRGMLNFYIYNEITHHRHLVVTIRKDWLCQCGCRGW